MNDGIAVINGGSSSIKFSLYRLDGGHSLALCFRGEIEGIATRSLK